MYINYYSLIICIIFLCVFSVDDCQQICQQNQQISRKNPIFQKLKKSKKIVSNTFVIIFFAFTGSSGKTKKTQKFHIKKNIFF